ncbi:hypothetical protein [Bradyrhizobium sp. WSM2793]|nr:hypothetical protein [Bradyrhizobium sp. WSM2793]
MRAVMPQQGVFIFTMMAAIAPLIALLRRDGRALGWSLLAVVLVCWLASYPYLVPVAILLIIASFGLACGGLSLRLPAVSAETSLWIRTIALYSLFFAITGYALNLFLSYNWAPPRILAEPLASPLNDRDGPMTATLNAQFPEGTDEAVLRASLLKDGFSDVAQPRPLCRLPEIRPGSMRRYGSCPAGSREMTYEYRGPVNFVCGSTHVSVKWSANPDGKIVGLQATGYTPCL